MHVKTQQPDLVRVFDVDAEAELFQEAPLCFYHVTLAADVALVQHQGTNTPDETLQRQNTRADTCCTGERYVTCFLRRV